MRSLDVDAQASWTQQCAIITGRGPMAFWRLYYHLVWAVKKRQPLITPEVEKTLYHYLALRTGGLRGAAFAIGGTADHIHLVATVSPGSEDMVRSRSVISRWNKSLPRAEPKETSR
jgi:REP element-mobilizing transposase RayT